jgi:hypothetical protein
MNPSDVLYAFGYPKRLDILKWTADGNAIKFPPLTTSKERRCCDRFVQQCLWDRIFGVGIRDIHVYCLDRDTRFPGTIDEKEHPLPPKNFRFNLGIDRVYCCGCKNRVFEFEYCLCDEPGYCLICKHHLSYPRLIPCINQTIVLHTDVCKGECGFIGLVLKTSRTRLVTEADLFL